MKKTIFTILLLASIILPTKIKAQPFFDTSDAPNLISFGARIGFNTSNRSFPVGNYTNQILTTSWGLGFNLGGVVNINFKEYLTLQPGLFFETRNSSLVNYNEIYTSTGKIENIYVSKDTQKSYKFTIPVMGVLKFNVSDMVRWNVEFGPYFQFNLKENGGQDSVKLWYWAGGANSIPYYAKHRGFDVGLKMGTAFQIYEHYYVGAHYLAGLCNAWSIPNGGKNKSWMFTLGYDF